MERTCNKCLVLISQKKTYSTDIKMLKRQAPNEKHQMLPYYDGKYNSKQIIPDFKSAKEVLMDTVKKMVGKRRLEMIFKAIETMTYTKYEDIPENEETFVHGFKHVKADKVDFFNWWWLGWIIWEW